jgi:C-terminal processing protease CtpA/Prc
MTIQNKYIALLILLMFAASCQKENYQISQARMEVNDFVWKGLNAYYLWKDEIPNLSDNKFNSQSELNDLLDDYPEPSDFFESLIYDRENIDHWSWIVSDYIALEKLFQGIRVTSGLHVGLVVEQAGSDNLFAYVKYVAPNSDAERKGMQRGQLFRKVNGQQLTKQNYRELFRNSSYDLELATWSGAVLADTGIVKHLEKTELAENPIFIKKIIHQNGKNIGYLMYNGFVMNYEQDLLNAFQFFKSENIDELILDLRYNPGGSVSTMQSLASMITGQFEGQTFLQYKWHQQLQNWVKLHYPNTLERKFENKLSNGASFNPLRLNKLYVIATKSSASASESLINCLDAYIDVQHIGTETHGKYVASITLYDSPDFSRNNVNTNHQWAMQPIVLKVDNAQGEGSFINGLTPDIFQAEDYHNMGELGNETEPLLNRALQAINGVTRPNHSINHFEEVYYLEQSHQDEMYLPSLPDGLSEVNR